MAEQREQQTVQVGDVDSVVDEKTPLTHPAAELRVQEESPSSIVHNVSSEGPHV